MSALTPSRNTRSIESGGAGTNSPQKLGGDLAPERRSQVMLLFHELRQPAVARGAGRGVLPPGMMRTVSG